MDLRGKTCVVTGANSGIGKAAALGLAKAGAEVVMACRDRARGEAALADVRSAVPAGRVELLPLDLGSFASIRAAAKELKTRHPRINVLINNAGIWDTKRHETVDGFERTFGVNHLGHFLWTRLLLDALEAGRPSRIVNVSSNLHYRGRLDWDDLQRTRTFNGTGAYAQSKLANVLFTRALAKRLPPGITANAVHPGVIATNLFIMAAPWLVPITGFFLGTPEKGAQPLVRLAGAPELEGVTGRYFDRLRERAPSPAALDDAAGERLWKLSEEWTAGAA